MSENIDGGSAESTDLTAESADTQLAEMRDAERAEPETSEAEAERPEVEVKVKEEKVVPLAALHEARNEIKTLRQQNQERDRLHAESMQRINQRLEMLANPPKQAPALADDPVTNFDHRINELTQTQRQILEQNYAATQQQQQERQIAQVKYHVSQKASEFARTTPDFHDAVAHLNELRTRELVAMGTPEYEAADMAVQELDNAAMQWAVNGKHPAQIAYDLAKARGYTPKAQGQTAQQKLESQQKGTAAARSLGSGGAVSAGKLTAEALASMSDEDFSKLTPSQWRQAMGG